MAKSPPGMMPKGIALLRHLQYVRRGHPLPTKMTLALLRSYWTAVDEVSRRHKRDEKQRQLTKTPIILKCTMQAHDARMSRAKADESAFLCEGGIELVVALEVTLVEYFDRIFLSRCTVCAMHDLWGAACQQGGAREGAS